MQTTTEQFTELYERLNPEQREAVDTIEGPLMVLAGPGTGKTQVIAMRIARILLETHMDPWNILCLTFTESGVVAMRERLLQIIGTPAYQVRINTFHSFCNDIIQEYPDIFARAKSWQMISDIERIDLYRSIIDTLPPRSPLRPLADPYMFLNAIADNIKKLKQEDISPAGLKKVLQKTEVFVKATQKKIDTFVSMKANERTDAQCEAILKDITHALQKAELPGSYMELVKQYYGKYEERFAIAEGKRQQVSARTALKNDIKKWFDKLRTSLPKQKDLHRVYEQYQERLLALGRYDYEDMIMSVTAEFKKNDELLAKYQEAYQYILVDEYQDTNGAQNEVVYLLGNFDSRPNICVVGDDKQSIYRFQGASVNNMLSFYERYKEGITVVSLQQNYRSQEVILQAAQGVIEHNQAALTQYIPNTTDVLKAATGRKTEPLKALVLGSEDMENHAVAEHIKKLLEQGVKPHEIAVLFRYNRDGRELLKTTQSLGIPARLEIGEDALADTTVQQWLTIFRYISDVRSEDLLADILFYNWWKLDALEILKVVRYTSEQRKRLLDVVTSFDELANADIKHIEQFLHVANLLVSWRKKAANTTLANFFYDVLSESEWLDYVLEVDDQLPVLQKVSTLLNKAKELNLNNKNLTINDFIASIKLLQEHGLSLETEPWQMAEEAVRLMTAHRSKGLEFEHVFIIRLNDKHWGNNPEPSKVPLPHGLVQYDPIVAQENNEDERRLFYVALTRAKQTVTLTRAKYNNNGRPTTPSIFLQEFAQELLEREEVQETPQESAVRIREVLLKPWPGINHEQVAAWIRTLLKKEIISVTHLNNYLECPRKFYVRNILKLPSARSFYQALGTAIHGALDDFYKTFHSDKKLPVKKQLLEFFETHLSRELLTSAEQRRIHQEGALMLEEYYRQYHKEMQPYVLGEYDFRRHGVVCEGIPITGKIDKIELLDSSDVLPDGTWKKDAAVNVVDYKTGNPDRGLTRLKPGKPYFRQLVFYKLLCDLSPQFEYEMVSGEVDFIQPSEKKGFIKQRVTITDDHVAELKEELQHVWSDIQNLKFLEESVACGKCEYCISE